MCKICRKHKCPSGCPNSKDDSEVLYVCAKCKYPIREGDYAYKINETTVWCDNCMMDAGFMAPG